MVGKPAAGLPRSSILAGRRRLAKNTAQNNFHPLTPEPAHPPDCTDSRCSFHSALGSCRSIAPAPRPCLTTQCSAPPSTGPCAPLTAASSRRPSPFPPPVSRTTRTFRLCARPWRRARMCCPRRVCSRFRPTRCLIWPQRAASVCC